MIDASGDSLQNSVIGEEPGDAAQATLTPPDFYRDYYNILQATPEIPADVRADFKDYFDASGNLNDWDSMDYLSPNRRGNGYLEILERLGGVDPGRIRDAYGDVVREDG